MCVCLCVCVCMYVCVCLCAPNKIPTEIKCQVKNRRHGCPPCVLNGKLSMFGFFGEYSVGKETESSPPLNGLP